MAAPARGDVKSATAVGTAIHARSKSAVSIQVWVRTLTNQLYPVYVDYSDTIQDLKLQIFKATQVDSGSQILTYASKTLRDNCTVADYALNNGSEIMLTLRYRDVADATTVASDRTVAAVAIHESTPIELLGPEVASAAAKKAEAEKILYARRALYKSAIIKPIAANTNAATEELTIALSEIPDEKSFIELLRAIQSNVSYHALKFTQQLQMRMDGADYGLGECLMLNSVLTRIDFGAWYLTRAQCQIIMSALMNNYNVLELYGDLFVDGNEWSDAASFIVHRNEIVTKSVPHRNAMNPSQWNNCRTAAEAAARDHVKALHRLREVKRASAAATRTGTATDIAASAAANLASPSSGDVKSASVPAVSASKVAKLPSNNAQLTAVIPNLSPTYETAALRRAREVSDRQTAIDLDRLLLPQSDAERHWKLVERLSCTELPRSILLIISSYEGSWSWSILLCRSRVMYVLGDELDSLDRLSLTRMRPAAGTVTSYGTLDVRTVVHAAAQIPYTRPYAHLTRARVAVSGGGAVAATYAVERRVRVVGAYVEAAPIANAPPNAPNEQFQPEHHVVRTGFKLPLSLWLISSADFVSPQWDVLARTHAPLTNQSGDLVKTTALHFFSDSAIFVAGRANGSISFWDVSAPKLYPAEFTLPKNTSPLAVLAESNAKLRSVHEQRVAEIKQRIEATRIDSKNADPWIPGPNHVPSTGVLLRTETQLHSGRISRMCDMDLRAALSPYPLFLTASWDKTILLSAIDYDPDRSTLDMNIVQNYGADAAANSDFRFSHGVYDMARVSTDWVVGGSYGYALGFDLNTAKCVSRIAEKDMWAVNAVCYISGRQILALGSMDAKVRLYDATQPRLVGSQPPTHVLEHDPAEGGIVRLTYLPNHQLLTVSSLGNLKSWDLRLTSRGPVHSWTRQVIDCTVGMTTGMDAIVVNGF